MHKLSRFIRDWTKAILTSLLLLLAFVFFVGNWFVVTSSSMENSLLMGDFVFVNKYSYGSRTPMSISLFDKIIRLDFLPYYRLSGTNEVQQSDVVAFNYPDLDTLVPIDQKSVWIKRILALPGDELIFAKGETILNGKKIKNPPTLKFNYHIQLIGDEAAFFYKYNITDASRVSTQNDWLISISKRTAEEMKNYSGVNFVRPQIKKQNDFEEEVYPYELDLGWNQDYFGPVVIPAKDMKIKLTLNNIALYRLCIKAYEGNELVEFGNKFFLNGKQIKDYTFKMDYYFVVGDNRHNSSDSRFWGFVPESHLIGKVSTVFFSVNKSSNNFWKKLRWNRIFEAVV